MLRTFKESVFPSFQPPPLPTPNFPRTSFEQIGNVDELPPLAVYSMNIAYERYQSLPKKHPSIKFTVCGCFLANRISIEQERIVRHSMIELL